MAESLGDLIYRRDNATAQNLRAVLENDFEAVRTGYRGKSALLALLYRHSLTHHDELRVLSSGGKQVGWKVSGDDDSRHMTAVRTRANAMVIEFQLRIFYTDIIKVCESAEKALEWARADPLQRGGCSWISMLRKPTAPCLQLGARLPRSDLRDYRHTRGPNATGYR